MLAGGHNPRPTLRGTLRHGRAHDRHLLPAGLPRTIAAAAERALFRRRVLHLKNDKTAPLQGVDGGIAAGRLHRPTLDRA